MRQLHPLPINTPEPAAASKMLPSLISRHPLPSLMLRRISVRPRGISLSTMSLRLPALIPRRGASQPRDRRQRRAIPLLLLLHYIRPSRDILLEATDGTCDFLVSMRREGNDRDEADGEPGPAGSAPC